MASSFSSSSPHTWKDNVFLSFYGPDVRQTFLSHLLNQFKYNGINFFDDQDIERRQITAPLFIEAIRESRISIIVLSKKYASSSWCLDELLEILNCRENWQKVIPVFYRVKHSDVRNQAGDFGNTFNETCAHKTEEVKMKWSHALTHVGNIAGVHVYKIWTNEAEMIELIVRHVSDKLWKYNVFTSFRGDDVRNKLISHLRNKFEDKGITMFDDSKIKKGHIISPALTEAIRESEIFIVVFSKNYASSSWCLNELLEILKFNKNEQRVIPVFHEVDPSHVRKQAGDFGIAFNETCAGKTEEERIKWSQALTYVGYIAGEHFQNWTNEAEMIENIAKHVLNKLRVKPSKNC